MRDSKESRFPLYFVVMALAANILLYLNAGVLSQSILFSWSVLNSLFVCICAAAIPVSLLRLWLALFIETTLPERAGLFLVLVLMGFFPALVSLFALANAFDPFVKQVAEAKSSSAYFRLYTVPGIFNAGEFLLRKEIDSRVGLKLVSEVWKSGPVESNSSFRQVKLDSIKIESDAGVIWMISGSNKFEIFRE